MNETTLQACLRKITTLDKNYLPHRIVVELHLPLIDEEHVPDVDVSRTWALDNSAEVSLDAVGTDVVEPKSRTYSELTEVTGHRDYLHIPRPFFQIGFARLAPILGSELIYVDYQWWGQCGAGGLWRYDMARDEIVEVRTLWVS